MDWQTNWPCMQIGGSQSTINQALALEAAEQQAAGQPAGLAHAPVSW